MKKEYIATGSTVPEALENALAALGLRSGVDDFDQEVIDTPSKGFLGIGSRPAKVKVTVEVPDEKPAVKPAEPVSTAKPAAKPAEPKRAPQAKPVEKKAEAPAVKSAPAEKPEVPEKDVNFGTKPAIVEEYLRNIIAEMNIEGATVTVTASGKTIHAQIDGDDAGVTIGRRGETLDALQYLCGLAANRGEGDFVRIVVDSGTYRDKRRHTLEALAKRLANNAVKTGRSTTLEPMNPYERRIIHAAVAQVEGATSASTGEEPNRCVVISSLNPRPQSGSDRPRGGHGRGGDRGDRGPRNERGGRGGRGDRGRRPKPEPYHESGTREVAPAEAQNHSLYGKVEI